MKKKKLESDVEALKRDFGVYLSQYGLCPHCKQFAHHLDYWFFNKDWETLHLGFVCYCGARWEENYELTPLPITNKQDGSKVNLSPSEQLND